MIFIWDAETAERLEMMTLPKGSRSVSALGFSHDGKYISAADMSDDHNVHLFDLTQKDKKNNCVHLGAVKKDRKKIFQITWSPASLGTFVSCGVEHIFFWNVSPQLTGKKAKMPGGKPGQKLGFPSVAYSALTGVALLAGSDGTIYTYNNGAPGKSFKAAHTKMVSCIQIVPSPDTAGGSENELVITGGGDKMIHMHLLDKTKNLTLLMSVPVAATPISVDFMNDKILAGLSNGTILELVNVISDSENI